MADGEHNGTVERIQYFVTRERYGIMVRESELRVRKGVRGTKVAVTARGKHGNKAVGGMGIPATLLRAMEEKKGKKASKEKIRRKKIRSYTPPIKYYDLEVSKIAHTSHQSPAKDSPAELLRSYSGRQMMTRPSSRGPESNSRRGSTASHRRGRKGTRGKKRGRGKRAYDPDYDVNESEEGMFGVADDHFATTTNGGAASGDEFADGFPLRSGLRVPDLPHKYQPSMQPCRFAVGDRVLTNEARVLFQNEGVVRYVGYVERKKGLWLGVELDQELPVGIKQLPNFCGPHDGSLEGAWYFSTRPGTGIFIRPSAIELQDPNILAIREAEERQRQLASKLASTPLPTVDLSSPAPPPVVDEFETISLSRLSAIRAQRGGEYEYEDYGDYSYEYDEYEYDDA